jgi:hypothetical protein
MGVYIFPERNFMVCDTSSSVSLKDRHPKHSESLTDITPLLNLQNQLKVLNLLVISSQKANLL